MMFTQYLLIILVFFSTSILFAQENEYSSFEGETENKLEWSGNLDAKYSIYNMDKSSSLFKLQFLKNLPTSSSLSQYKIEPYLNAEFKSSEYGFTLKTHATYYNDDNSSFDLFEGFANYNPSFNTSLQAGKKVYSWGKGYAFNPVGFVNPIKDPENPELAQAGLLSANVEYIKSFSTDNFQNFSFLAVLIPTNNVFGTNFVEVQNTDIAVKTSFLIYDTDIDFLLYYSNVKPKQFGFDFARNIKENIEIHGEISLNQNAEKFTIENNLLTSKFSNNYSFLLGFRYLDKSNTTLIAEYYKNGNGLSKNEFVKYIEYLNNGANSSNLLVAQQTLFTSQSYFKGTTLMQDYLYVKISHPEPFDWLYFTPSIYTIFNIADNSLLLSFQLSYKPINNTEFIFWTSLFEGKGGTEYAEKQVKNRAEIWMRAFF